MKTTNMQAFIGYAGRMARLPLAMLAFLPALLPLQNAHAQQNSYPDRVVKIIAPYAPGGTVDAIARAFAQAYSDRLGKTFIVENRPGAGGNIGLGALVRAPADGYTIGIGPANITAVAALRSLYPNPPFDPLKDFAPVSFIGRVPLVLIVNPGVPAQNLKELISLLKSKKENFNYSSSGIGNTAHLFGELFKQRAGVEMQHVPYKSSGEALMEVVSGRVHLQFATPVELMPQLARGAVRPIAVAGPGRLAALPNVPTLAELGMPGFESPTWFSIIAPAGTPKEIIAMLNEETRKAMAKPAVKARLAQAGVEPDDMTPDQLRAFMAEEVARWESIVKAGVKFD
jgi:tripartite-type tricarboxylate transporter receptor subunit TctC